MNKHLSILFILIILLVLLRIYNGRVYEGFEVEDKSIIIFKAEWCGHCKTAKPEFDKLVGASPITLKDGSKATVKVLDADKHKDEITPYKIRGFPTILVANGGTTTEYPGPRTSDEVIKFINSNY
jgi:thiol-disulfide isomerase/thioredoxin